MLPTLRFAALLALFCGRSRAENLTEGNSSSSNLTVALVGMTGNGKSTTGNLLCNFTAFATGDDFDSVTKELARASCELAGNMSITILDMPGSSDPSNAGKEGHEPLLMAMSELPSLVPEGIHVILLQLDWGRYTRDQKDAVEILQRATNGTAAWKNVILTIKNGEKGTAQKLIQSMRRNRELSTLLDDVGDRVVPLDLTSEKKKEESRAALLLAIQALVHAADFKIFDSKKFEKAREAKMRVEERVQEAYEKGRIDGFNEGYAEGIRKGYDDGRAMFTMEKALEERGKRLLSVLGFLSGGKLLGYLGIPYWGGGLVGALTLPAALGGLIVPIATRLLALQRFFVAWLEVLQTSWTTIREALEPVAPYLDRGAELANSTWEAAQRFGGSVAAGMPLLLERLHFLVLAAWDGLQPALVQLADLVQTLRGLR